MSKIANTILCYSIAIILLLFGIRFDEAGVLFDTQNTKNSNVAVCVAGATISEVESTITQFVGTKSESQVEQLVNQSQNTRRDSRMVFCILILETILKDFSDSNKVTCEINSIDFFHRVAVLNYIHDLDGKKRV